MAHQAHNIPWDLLTSNLEWKTPAPHDNFATNFYPRMKPNQANDLNYFVQKFVKNLSDHAACERKKYPARYDAPEPSDVILDEGLVRKISPTVRRWRDNCSWPLEKNCPSGKCRGSEYNRKRWGPGICICELIPREQRLMAAFLQEPEHFEPGYSYMNHVAFFNAQILQTLLLYGEMDTILRICAHPDAHSKLEFWCYGYFFSRV